MSRQSQSDIIVKFSTGDTASNSKSVFSEVGTFKFVEGGLFPFFISRRSNYLCGQAFGGLDALVVYGVRGFWRRCFMVMVLSY